VTDAEIADTFGCHALSATPTPQSYRDETEERRRAFEAALRDVEATLSSRPDDLDALFERGALLARLGRDDEAKQAYLEVLRRDVTHFGALTNLGGLALASGHRSAALSAYAQAADHHPERAPASVNLANLLLEDGRLDEARQRYLAALAADPDCAEAHQGLGLSLFALGEAGKADVHWRKGFAGRELVAKPYRGDGPPVRVLLLVSGLGGNIPTALLLDDRVFAVTALYAEFHDRTRPLPAHDLVFNAIGDAELCGEALAGAVEVLVRTGAPVINPPKVVLATTREANARRMAGLPGVVAPRTERLSRRDLTGDDAAARLAALTWEFPLLLRSPGFHTGQHFVRVEEADDLVQAAGQLPGESLLAIQPLNALGADGLARKYRVMMIDGELYPLHMAASTEWKVHYFTSAMADRPDLRAEEAAFLTDMPGVLGRRAMAALLAIRDRLGLDYAGIDFGLSPHGDLLVFEANATMTITPPDADPIWNYRREAIARALDAAKTMLRTRAACAAAA
jgi:tetratricopeptide (TPR) repeat protein/glutathione synthase/RimK-type ligase-like ATP-grasp enzyme